MDHPWKNFVDSNPRCKTESLPVASPRASIFDAQPLSDDGPSLSGYAPAPPFAWQGFRLGLPGGGPGGQYHGFEAIGSSAPAPPLSPYLASRRGVALGEGDTMSDYVYRSPAELRPRANASGPTNAIESYQEAKDVGFAEVPGAYGGSYHRSAIGKKQKLGAIVVQPRSTTTWGSNPPKIVVPVVRSGSSGSSGSTEWGGSGYVPTGPYQPLSPSPVVNAPTTPYPSTSTIYSCQNPDPQCVSAGETCGPFPNGCMPYSVSNPDPRCVAEGATGGPYPTCTANYNLDNPDPKCTAMGMTGGPYPNCTALPAVNTSGIDTATNDPECVALGMTGGPYPNCTPSSTAGTVAASATTASSGGIEAWLSESTIIGGVSNLMVVAGGILAIMLLKKK